MLSLLNNRYLKFAGFGLGVIVLLFILWMGVNLMGSATGLSDSDFDSKMIPSTMPAYDGRGVVMESAEMATDDSLYYAPTPTPGNYTANLESYETTHYAVSGKTKEFDEMCQTIINLKADQNIHFQSINTQTNYCRANFFVEEEQADAVVNTLSSFKGVEINRDTSSVTRHRQQLQSRTKILQEQLVRVESTLTAAEAQLARLNSRFYNTDEVTEISTEITNSLRFIDQMTNQKINLISQLDSAYQQAADLEARMGVVEFSVNVSRSNPIYPNKHERAWDNAWNDLKDTANDTLIGITAFFGIFLLWLLRITIYLLVVIVILRLLWKFGRLVWNRL